MDPSSITNQEKRFYRVLQIPVYNPGEPPGNPDPSRWTWLQPGLYSMGSPDSATYRESDEAPVTRVTLTHGFWMSRYEVIQEEYQSLMGTNPSWFTNDLKRPVENVSWSDATNYCGQLTRHEQAAGRLPAGCLYRLPTEAEWEYSCRAGSTTRYSFGEDPTGSLLGYYAWVYDNSGSSVPPNGNFYFIDGKYYTSQATGSRQPNPWGLYDMHGNVWEWCLDWYQANLPGGSVVDPQGPTNGATRVIRGGSWNCGPQTCRSAYRCSSDPSVQSSGLGFRPILTTY
jgi:formylglycine-generating enzyme required for sulfatase activity